MYGRFVTWQQLLDHAGGASLIGVGLELSPVVTVTRSEEEPLKSALD